MCLLALHANPVLVDTMVCPFGGHQLGSSLSWGSPHVEPLPGIPISEDVAFLSQNLSGFRLCFFPLFWGTGSDSLHSTNQQKWMPLFPLLFGARVAIPLNSSKSRNSAAPNRNSTKRSRQNFTSEALAPFFPFFFPGKLRIRTSSDLSRGVHGLLGAGAADADGGRVPGAAVGRVSPIWTPQAVVERPGELLVYLRGPSKTGGFVAFGGFYLKGEPQNKVGLLLGSRFFLGRFRKSLKGKHSSLGSACCLRPSFVHHEHLEKSQLGVVMVVVIDAGEFRTFDFTDD